MPVVREVWCPATPPALRVAQLRYSSSFVGTQASGGGCAATAHPRNKVEHNRNALSL